MHLKVFLVSFFLTTASLCYAHPADTDLLISAEEIQTKICQTAQILNQDYRDKDLTIVMIMKGSLCITADLIRYLNVPFTLEYVQASSYGYNGTKAGKLTLANIDSLDIQDRDILLVDDIFETGKTILGVMEALQAKHPRSLKTLLLLVKDVPRKTTYRPDYVLFNIPDRFVIGYGLDYKELYRGLPDICAFINDQTPF